MKEKGENIHLLIQKNKKKNLLNVHLQNFQRSCATSTPTFISFPFHRKNRLTLGFSMRCLHSRTFLPQWPRSKPLQLDNPLGYVGEFSLSTDFGCNLVEKHQA